MNLTGHMLAVVERLYCKRPILCLASSKILTPHPLTARRVCTPPPAGGGHTRWVERGVEGQYFGRRQTQLCTLYICKYFVLAVECLAIFSSPLHKPEKYSHNKHHCLFDINKHEHPPIPHKNTEVLHTYITSFNFLQPLTRPT
jgi:hypothetical protein